MEIIENRAVVFDTLYPEIITRTVAKASILEQSPTQSKVLVPWNYSVMCTLASLGAPYLSPIKRDYKFPGPYEPKEHQLLICNLATMHKRGFCFADMGMGKTASFAWAMGYLKELGLIKHILIVCPKVVMRAAWQHELAMLFPFDSVSVLDGTPEVRKRRLARHSTWDIVNYDGVEILLDELKNRDYDVVIVDESTMIKNPETKRWKALNQITQHVERLWLLTAAPTPQGPMDAYGQVMLVSPELVPKNVYEFRNRTMQVGRPSFKTRTGKTVPPEWIAKPNAAEILEPLFYPCIRVDKDSYDLPEVFDIPYEVELSTEQKSAIKKLHATASKLAEVNESIAGGFVRQVYQIASGCLYERDDMGERTVKHFDATPRLQATVELIDEGKMRFGGDGIGGKTVVYVAHRHVCDFVYEYLSKKYKVGKINGDTTNRAEILRAFDTTEEYEVIVAVASAMSHGVTAIAANTIVWYSPSPSVEVFMQANNRTDRIGQKQIGRRYYLFANDAERERHETLQNGQTVQNEMLNLYKTFLESM